MAAIAIVAQRLRTCLQSKTLEVMGSIPVFAVLFFLLLRSFRMAPKSGPSGAAQLILPYKNGCLAVMLGAKQPQYTKFWPKNNNLPQNNAFGQIMGGPNSCNV